MKALLMMTVALGLLAACGADGPPETPSRDAPVQGLSVSGDARIGVVRTW